MGASAVETMKVMGRFASGLAALSMGLALGLAAAAAPPVAAESALDPARVGAFVDGAVAQAMSRDRIAGVSVAVVDHDGVVTLRGYGVASRSPARAVGPDTLFRVGSISKTPVWIAVMQLVEAGKIGLDDPINEHLPPDLRIPDDGFREPIRVRHLMTHSAGFEDSVLGGFFVRRPEELMPLEAWLRSHRVRRVREPGVLAVYSNYGAALAGAMVAHVSGEAWEDYAERHIFRPLGMTTATYREPYSDAVARARRLPAPLPPGLAAQVTAGFSETAGALRAEPWEYVGNVAPAGALSASARDMAVYMGALLDPARLESAGVLRAATFRAMRAPLFANTPELGAWRHGFMDYTLAKGRPGFGHGGDLIFQHSTMEIYPQAGIGIFVSVNTPAGETLRDTLPEAIMARFAGPLPALPPRPANARAEGARVAGTYRSLRLPAFRTEHAILSLLATRQVTALPDGDVLMPSGDRVVRFQPIGGGVFAAEGEPGRIAFHTVGGRLLRFDSISAAPWERISFIEGPVWLMAIAALTTITAIWGVAAAARRLFRRGEKGRAAGWVLDGLCVVWLGALALFLSGLALLGDSNTAVFAYPGPLLPAGGWALLAAAAATPAAALLVLFPVRPKGWSAWRWIRQAWVLTVFTAFAATLYAWGMLGYSGW